MKDPYEQYRESLKKGTIENSRKRLDGIGVPTLLHGDVFTIYCSSDAKIVKFKKPEGFSFYGYKITLPNGREVEFELCRSIIVERENYDSKLDNNDK